MRSIRQGRRDAKKLFRLCLDQGAMDQERVREVVQLLCRSTRRNRFNVLSAFLRLVELDCFRHTALVESAVSLPAEIQASVQAGLSRAYGPRMNVSFGVRSGLIGGMRIKAASDVYDGSVEGRLAALDARFRNGQPN